MRELVEKLFLLGMDEAIKEGADATPENIQAVAKAAINVAAEFERAWAAHSATQKANVEEDEDEPYLGTRIG